MGLKVDYLLMGLLRELGSSSPLEPKLFVLFRCASLAGGGVVPSARGVRKARRVQSTPAGTRLGRACIRCFSSLSDSRTSEC